MQVKHMQGCRIQLDVNAQAAAAFAPARGEIVVPADVNRESRQDEVPVSSSLEPTSMAEGHMESESLRDEARLILVRVPAFDTDNFLQRNNISIDSLKDVHNPSRIYPLVHSATLVDIVGDYAQMARC
jgi:hypothetical protein